MTSMFENKKHRYILLFVLLGLILLGQHAFRTTEIYIAFCATWVTLVSNYRSRF